jgi:hypothetical protein
LLCRSNSYCNNTDIYLSKESYVSSFFEKNFLDTAIKKDHIVKAKLIKKHYINDYTQSGVVYPTDEKMATYEYNYNGKTYRRRFVSFNEFADEVNLYFISNPAKTEFGDNIWTTAKNHWIRSFFLMILLLTIILWFIVTFKFIQWSDLENMINSI